MEIGERLPGSPTHLANAADAPLREALMECLNVAHAELSQEDTGGVEVPGLIRKKEQLPVGYVLCQYPSAAVIDPASCAR